MTSFATYQLDNSLPRWNAYFEAHFFHAEDVFKSETSLSTLKEQALLLKEKFSSAEIDYRIVNIKIIGFIALESLSALALFISIPRTFEYVRPFVTIGVVGITTVGGVVGFAAAGLITLIAVKILLLPVDYLKKALKDQIFEVDEFNYLATMMKARKIIDSLDAEFHLINKEYEAFAQLEIKAEGMTQEEKDALLETLSQKITALGEKITPWDEWYKEQEATIQSTGWHGKIAPTIMRA